MLKFDLSIPPRRGRAPSTGALVDLDPTATATLHRLHERLATLPNVRAVAGISAPLVNAIVQPVMPIVVDSIPPDPVNVVYFMVTPGFFSAIRTPLVRGREFTGKDVTGARPVAMVNEEAARRFWPGEDPIGRTVRLSTVPDEHPRRIVGVVPNIPLVRAQLDPRPVVYTPYLQQPSRYPPAAANMFGRMTFMLRVDGDPWSLVPAVQSAVADVAPGRPLARVFTMDQQLGAAGIDRRPEFVASIAIFATIAMCLAAIGIYGIVAFSVAQRTSEIAIRVALGARPLEVVQVVGREALLVTAGGLLGGVAISRPLVTVLDPQLWGIRATDPPTFTTAAVLLLATACVAALVPLRRAMRVDPAAVLRAE